MRVSKSVFAPTIASANLRFTKRSGLSLPVCKIVAVLFLVLFSVDAVSAGPYSNCSYDELVKLSKKFKAQGGDYTSQAKKFEDLARPYRYKYTTSATTIYTNYMLQSSKYYQLASQAYAQQLKVEEELSERRRRVTKITVSVSQSSVKLTSTVICCCKAVRGDGSVTTVEPTWSVSNRNYGYISGFTFHPSAAGIGKKVTVKAVYNGFSASKTISISSSVKLTSLAISGSPSVPYCGTKSYMCSAKYSDNTLRAVTPVWSVSNSQYGSFSGSSFTAKGAGAGKTVTITASFEGRKVSRKITLKQRVLSSLSLKGASTVKVGAKTTLSCTAKFTSGATGAVKPAWSSSNTKVAVVSSSGVVTGKKAGTATITAKYKENGVAKSATKKITVKQITGLSVSGSPTVGVKSKITLTASAKYSNGDTAVVKPAWSSSNTAVATVSSSGVVTGKKGGTVTITAKYQESGVTKTASKKIAVVKKAVGLTVSGASSLDFGNSTTMVCTAKYDDGTEAQLTPSWSITEEAHDGFKGVNYSSINDAGVLRYQTYCQTTFNVVVNAYYQGCAASKTVKMTHKGALSPGDYISGPDTLQYLGSGSYYLYLDGQKVTSASVSWSCGFMCTMSDQGCYGLLKVTSQPPGPLNSTVIATYNGRTVTKGVRINP